MRIKKREIVEAVIGAQATDNNTTTSNNNSIESVPNPDELKQVSDELKDIKATLDNTEIPFIKKVDENLKPNKKVIKTIKVKDLKNG
jgi:transcriptional/translational regulatory protein YebC/TACO1